MFLVIVFMKKKKKNQCHQTLDEFSEWDNSASREWHLPFDSRSVFLCCTQYERSIHFPIIVNIITPLDGAQCSSWPETFKVSSTELFTFLKARFPKDWLSNEKDLGDEIKTQKGLSFIAFGPERKKKDCNILGDKTLVGRLIDNNGLKTHADCS